MSITINGTTGIAGVDGSAGTPAVQGNDTNTGIFFPAADTIAFAEGGTEVMRLDSSANLQFNSGYGSIATAYGCRAWVNFNGTGTVAIRQSGNVSSITDNNTGDYTVNFSTSMPDSDYSVVALGNTGSNNGYITLISTASGSCNITTRTSSSIGPDGTIICAAVFR
jgi:hypothetical protein